MGLFRKKDPQRYFEGLDFTVTGTIFEAPTVALLPTVYQDEGRRLWAVRQPGASPAIFGYDDMLGCEVAELGASTELEGLSGKERLKAVIANPGAVSRANAAKRGVCGGLGVVVRVRVPGEPGADDVVARLELPVSMHEMRRGSGLYERAQNLARSIKASFDAMAPAGAAQAET